MAEVERVADRVGLIRNGRMARELSMAEIEQRAASRNHLTFLGPVEPSDFDGVPQVGDVTVGDGEVIVTMDGPVADLLTRAGELGASTIETERQDPDDVGPARSVGALGGYGAESLRTQVSTVWSLAFQTDHAACSSTGQRQTTSNR